MSRRVFLKSLTAPLGGFSLPAVAHTKPDKVKWKTLQISPVAGFQYYQGESLWPQLDAGQLLTLTREADNPYDDRAVCIDWQRHKLGYIPWMDNAAISQLIDRGEKVKAVCAEKDALYAALNQEDWNWRCRTTSDPRRKDIEPYPYVCVG